LTAGVVKPVSGTGYGFCYWNLKLADDAGLIWLGDNHSGVLIETLYKMMYLKDISFLLLSKRSFLNRDLFVSKYLGSRGIFSSVRVSIIINQ